MDVGISGGIAWVQGFSDDTDMVVKPACKVTPLRGRNAFFHRFATNIELLKERWGVGISGGIAWVQEFSDDTDMAVSLYERLRPYRAERFFAAFLPILRS